MDQQKAKMHCGKTRSGKEITYRLVSARQLEEGGPISGFGNVDDDFDAYALFRYLCAEEWRRDKNGEFYSLFFVYQTAYARRVNEKVDLKEYQIRLGINDASDLIRFGRERAALRSGKKS